MMDLLPDAEPLRRLPYLRNLRGTSEAAVTAFEKLEALHDRRVGYRNGESVAERQGQPVFFVQAGWFLQQDRTNGGRQVVSELHLPGDAFTSRPGEPSRSTRKLIAAGAAELAIATADEVRRASTANEAVARALDWSAERRLYLALDHVKMLGALRAIEKVRHFLADTWLRSRAVGLATEESFDMPLTQTQIGEVCGMSLVHTNKSIAKLRADGVISITGARVRIAEPSKFLADADIDSSLYTPFNVDPA